MTNHWPVLYPEIFKQSQRQETPAALGEKFVQTVSALMTEIQNWKEIAFIFSMKDKKFDVENGTHE